MQRSLFATLVFLTPAFFFSQQNPQPPGQGQKLPTPIGFASPHYQAEFTPLIANGVRLASWSNGYLVGFGVAGGAMKEPVTVYDKTGKWLFENWLTFEGAIMTYGHDAKVTKSGTAIVAAATLNSDGAMADMIVEVGKGGIQRAIRTSPFDVLRLCVTDEGTVWAYGREMTDDHRAERQVHYPMLREYSFEKGELRSALDRATIRVPKEVPLQGPRGEVQMRCSRGKVVLVQGLTNELIEYDLAASKLVRWPITPLPQVFYINGAAVTDSGELYVSTFRPGQNAQTGMLHLHVSSSGMVDWTPLTIEPPTRGNFFLLLGNDGEDLVYARGRAAPTLFWSKAPEPEVKK